MLGAQNNYTSYLLTSNKLTIQAIETDVDGSRKRSVFLQNLQGYIKAGHECPFQKRQ